MINRTVRQPPVNIEQFLLEVRKPARYIGNEFNSIKKEQTQDMINFALCFADAYELGMSHLGVKILYSILNQLDDVYCERCFAPWIDMEQKMREHKIPLFAIETARPITNYDIIGFSLQYELGYTNLLNMLDLSNIPLLRKDRDMSHPLIIAGGPCCTNPEPMADFIDVFFIGEAEELIIEFVKVFQEFKDERCRKLDFSDKIELKDLRDQLFKKLSQIPGLYIPKFYAYDQNNGLISENKDIPKTISRRFVADLDSTAYFTKPPVPYIEIVHDRISIEIMRGCPNKCLFCQAGFTINPVRIRKIDTILDLAKQTYANTGYDNISFCALSSASYPNLIELIKVTHAFCQTRGMGISLPSLRVDTQFLGLISLLEGLRKTGLTFAPEAASSRLRKIINKDIDIEALKQAVLEAYRKGWKRLKLYFMIGLPTETEEDLLAIVKMIEDFSALRKSIDGRWGQVSVGISNFIPKCHTPFQWLGMQTMEVLQQKQDFLRQRLKRKNFEVDFQDPAMSFVEACMSRGDRRVGAVIKQAFDNGARFDAWTGVFDFELWKKAFTISEIDLNEYVYKQKNCDAALSWDHIDCGFAKQTLINYAKTIAAR